MLKLCDRSPGHLPAKPQYAYWHCVLAQDSPQCSTEMKMNKTLSFLAWGTVALLGAFAVGVVALRRGEPINALWLVVAATCCYALGYRFYSKFIATKILALDAKRAHSGRASGEWPRLPRHQQVGSLWPPFRSHRRPWTPGRSRPGGAVWLSPWHSLDPGRRGVRWLRAGLRDFVVLRAS